jgi:hypothetical protein
MYIPLNTSDDCLADLEHDHIHEEIFLSLYFSEVFFYYMFSINTRSDFFELINMVIVHRAEILV